ncbi:hypothetical protein ACLEPN_22730 [Myxococcus sp. 1LA]
MSGTINQSHPLYSTDLGLTYAIGNSPPDYYRPVNNIVWGVFNMDSRPGITRDFELVCPTGNRLDCYRRTELYVASLPYVFNPSAGLQLKSIKFAHTFGSSSEPTPFRGVPSRTVFIDNQPLPNGIAIEVKMRTTSPTRYFDDDLVFYKVYTSATTP